jgi:hypothetical protein
MGGGATALCQSRTHAFGLQRADAADITLHVARACSCECSSVPVVVSHTRRYVWVHAPAATSGRCQSARLDEHACSGPERSSQRARRVHCALVRRDARRTLRAVQHGWLGPGHLLLRRRPPPCVHHHKASAAAGPRRHHSVRRMRAHAAGARTCHAARCGSSAHRDRPMRPLCCLLPSSNLALLGSGPAAPLNLLQTARLRQAGARGRHTGSMAPIKLQI